MTELTHDKAALVHSCIKLQPGVSFQRSSTNPSIRVFSGNGQS